MQLVRVATQALQLPAGAGQIAGLVEQLVAERQHLVGSYDKRGRHTGAYGQGFRPRKRDSNIACTGRGLSRSQFAFENSLVHLRRNDTKP
jgi:hypothetical protein